jgi:hypothetical protein
MQTSVELSLIQATATTTLAQAGATATVASTSGLSSRAVGGIVGGVCGVVILASLFCFVWILRRRKPGDDAHAILRQGSAAFNDVVSNPNVPLNYSGRETTVTTGGRLSSP